MSWHGSCHPPHAGNVCWPSESVAGWTAPPWSPTQCTLEGAQKVKRWDRATARCTHGKPLLRTKPHLNPLSGDQKTALSLRRKVLACEFINNVNAHFAGICSWNVYTGVGPHIFQHLYYLWTFTESKARPILYRLSDKIKGSHRRESRKHTNTHHQQPTEAEGFSLLTTYFLDMTKVTFYIL